MAAGSNIKLWDVQDKLELISLAGGASQLAFSPDGRFLVALNGAGARVFEGTAPAPAIQPPPTSGAEPPLSNQPPPDPLPAATRQAVRRGEKALEDHDPAGALLWAVQALRTDPQRAERHRVHVGLLLQNMPLLGGTQPVQVLTPELPTGPAEDMLGSTLSDDGRLIAYHKPTQGDSAASVHVYDVRTGKEAGPRIWLKDDALDTGPHPVCLVPGGKQIVVSCWASWSNGRLTDNERNRSHRLRTYAIDTGTPVGPGIDPGPPYDWRARFWITGDGGWLVAERIAGPLVGAPPMVMDAWSLKTGKKLALPQPFNRLSFSGNGRFVLAAASALGPPPSSRVAVVYDLQTGERVGPGLRLPRTSFDRIRLSADGRIALFVDDNGRRLRVYTVADGRCTIDRGLAWNNPAVAISPQGNRVAVRDGGISSIVEFRDVFTGRLVAEPLATPNRPEHLEFSADGRLLVMSDSSSVRLLDTDSGLPLGPRLPLTSSDYTHTDLPDNDCHLAADGTSLLTRADWPKRYRSTSRFRVWDLKPDARSLDELDALAELYAGRKLTAAGNVAPLSVDEYRSLWKTARNQHAAWFAPQAPALAEKVPALPPPPKKVAGAETRPEQKPDYAGVFRRLDGADKPPLVSIVAALEEKNAGVRRAALDAALALERGKGFTLDLLLEAVKDGDTRDWAIGRLASLGPDAAPAVPVLIVELDWAQKQNSRLRNSVARALGKIGPGAAAAVPALRQLLAGRKSRGNVDFEIEAARALGRIGPKALPAAPDMIDLLLKYPEGNQQAVLVRALERVSVGAGKTLVPALSEALRPPARQRVADRLERRVAVADFIARLGPEAKGTAPALRAVLAEPPHDLLRPAAAAALWHVEGGAKDALGVLLAALTEGAGYEPGRSSHRGRAAQALGRIGPPAKAALPALMDQMKNGWTPFDRLDAAEALWRIQGDAKPLLPFLIGVLQEKPKESGSGGPLPPRLDTSVQARAIAVLAQMGAAAREAAPALAAAIRAEDQFNARQTSRVRVLKQDDEDEDPDTSELLRRTGLPVLQQLDPAAARALGGTDRR